MEMMTGMMMVMVMKGMMTGMLMVMMMMMMGITHPRMSRLTNQ